MILLTVGTQLDFDRLVTAMDAIAPALGQDIVAQTGPSRYRPANFIAQDKIAPEQFENLAAEAQVIVAHAGIGTVMLAQRLGKPLVILPRRADLGEHRNDHQLATTRALEDRAGIFVAESETQLVGRIETALRAGDWAARPSPTLDRLRASVAHFIDHGSL